MRNYSILNVILSGSILSMMRLGVLIQGPCGNNKISICSEKAALSFEATGRNNMLIPLNVLDI